MILPGSPLFPPLHLLADTIDPALALLALLRPAMRPSLGSRCAVGLYLVAMSLGVAGVYAVGAADAAFSVWGRFGLDYSTHTAFAVSLALSTGLTRPRWGWALIAAVLLHSTLLGVLGFHGAGDIATSGAVAMLATAPWHVLRRET
jgi:hypothetical protein